MSIAFESRDGQHSFKECHVRYGARFFKFERPTSTALLATLPREHRTPKEVPPFHRSRSINIPLLRSEERRP